MNRQGVIEEIRAEIDLLQQVLQLLETTTNNGVPGSPPEPSLRDRLREQAEAETNNGGAAPTKRQFSEARREQMRKIMKARWKKAKRAGLSTPAKV